MNTFETRLAASPVITVPIITLEGDANGVPHPEASAYARKFAGKYATASSPEASATIFRKRPRRPLPRPSSTSTTYSNPKESRAF